MNLDEYRNRLERNHSFTGVPSYWEKLQEALSIGDRLADFVASHVICSCRREWVCNKCQTMNEWKAIRND